MNNLGSKTVMARNIQYYMDKKSISRKKLASDLDISYTTLSSWLQADSYPRIDKIELMAKYFGISKSDLVEDKSKTTSTDLDAMLDNARSYDGKKMDDHDRDLIRTYLKGLFDAKK